MPRQANGTFTLVPGNPVSPNTLIEAGWANTTMDDIALGLTNSLPINGTVAMTGPLTLSGPPTLSTSATNKAYVDQFIAYATGLPLAAVIPIAVSLTIPGFLLCDGAAVSRTVYADLFGAIGTTFGVGDNSTTFNVPDLRDFFIRGRGAARPVGSTQSGSLQSHVHPVTDPLHSHTVTNPEHAHTSPAHGHPVIDPGHTHQISGLTNYSPSQAAGFNSFYPAGNVHFPSSAAVTGVVVNPVAVGVDAATQNTTVAAAVSGVTIAAAGGTETVPQNMALDYYIKAVQDSTASLGVVTGITSSDSNMIAINSTNSAVPELDIKSNVALGTVKLDASGRVPVGLLPSTTQQLLGYWNASSGQTPSQAFPSTNFGSGDTFIVSVTGTLTVYDPVTLVASPTVVDVGAIIQFIDNSSTNPTGWYYVVSTSIVVAGLVSMIPVGTISATNVQAGFTEVDGDLTTLAGGIATNSASITALQTGKVTQTSGTGAANLPVGSTAQRPASPILGQIRYSNELSVFEGYAASGWGAIGGGITQAQGDIRYVLKAGDTVTGNLTAVAMFVSTTQALAANALTRKDYVDTTVANSTVPAGTIIDFSGTAAPAGYLACPQVPANISRTAFPALFAAISTTWGAGDGSTTFGMPYFPADYAGTQSNNNVGTLTTGSIKSHVHSSALFNTLSGANNNAAMGSGSAPGNLANSMDGGSGATAANIAASIRILKCVKV